MVYLVIPPRLLNVFIILVIERPCFVLVVM